MRTFNHSRNRVSGWRLLPVLSPNLSLLCVLPRALCHQADNRYSCRVGADRLWRVFDFAEEMADKMVLACYYYPCHHRITLDFSCGFESRAVRGSGGKGRNSSADTVSRDAAGAGTGGT